MKIGMNFFQALKDFTTFWKKKIKRKEKKEVKNHWTIETLETLD